VVAPSGIPSWGVTLLFLLGGVDRWLKRCSIKFITNKLVAQLSFATKSPTWC
jgi:hypothetical protein